MNKEELEKAVSLLESNVASFRDQTNNAQTELDKAQQKLRDLGKPVITEDVANKIISRVCSAFCESLSNIDSDSIEIDFSMDYDNRIVVDGISGFDEVDADEDSIMEILIDTFNIDHSNGEDDNDID
jgi:hypothetical protein